MKAESISSPEMAVRQASDVMLLMISSNVWDLLVAQAQGEGKSPGVVLAAAMRAYVEEHGVDEAKDFLKRLDGQPGAQGGRR